MRPCCLTCCVKQVLAVIVHLGDLEFECVNKVVRVANNDVATLVEALLGVSDDQLMKTLCRPGGDGGNVPVYEAGDVADAISAEVLHSPPSLLHYADQREHSCMRMFL